MNGQNHNPSLAQPGGEEQAERLAELREAMARKGLDGIVITSPEPIKRLAGLDHFGFFAFTALVIGREGELQLVIRRMEAATLKAQAPHCIHVPYEDGANPVSVVADALERAGQASGRVGYEEWGLSAPEIRAGLEHALPDVEWIKASGMLSALRETHSEPEVERLRKAAKITDVGLAAGLRVAAEGVPERLVAAMIHFEMYMAGSETCSFPEWIRSGDRVKMEHVTWDPEDRIAPGPLFLELSGSVGRIHAPATRFAFVGEAPNGIDEVVEEQCAGFDRICEVLHPEARAREVYAAWEAVVGQDNARHHCGYLLRACSYPPSWVGWGTPIGLGPDSDLVVQAGMVFHVQSWGMPTRSLIPGRARPAWGLSNTVVVTEDGAEVLTKYPHDLVVIE